MQFIWKHCLALALACCALANAGTYDGNFIAVGTNDILALDSTGLLWAWGSFNDNGEQGRGDNFSVSVPTPSDKGPWSTVSIGSAHSLGLKPDGTLWGWGSNQYWQLGLASQTSLTRPKQLMGGTWISIVAFENHSLAIRSDSTLWGWGNNFGGLLGWGASKVPLQIGTAKWLKVVSGSSFIAALRADSTLWTWGSELYGELGRGTQVGSATPVQVGTTQWLDLAGMPGGVLAIQRDSTLWAWGSNNGYQLGDSSTTSRNVPTLISTAKWKSVAAGSLHSLGLRCDGSLWSWGTNVNGQLGLTHNNTAYRPQHIGTDTWLAVWAGGNRSYGRKADGTLWVWGYNGNTSGSTTGADDFSPRRLYLNRIPELNPLPTALPKDFPSFILHPIRDPEGKLLSVSVTKSALVDVKVAGDSVMISSLPGAEGFGLVTGWGVDEFGKFRGFSIPLRIGDVATIGEPHYRMVATGSYHTAALRGDSTLWTWGNNLKGQLGDGSTIKRIQPVPVGSSKWSLVSVGDSHTVAIQADSTLWAWGFNGRGQLGLDLRHPRRQHPVDLGFQQPRTARLRHSSRPQHPAADWLGQVAHRYFFPVVRARPAEGQHPVDLGLWEWRGLGDREHFQQLDSGEGGHVQVANGRDRCRLLPRLAQ